MDSISQGTESFNYSYDLLSRKESLTRPNGVTTSYQYDEVNRLKRLTHASSSQTIEDMQYGYNLDDEISSLTSLNSATLLPTSKTATTADEANRISQVGDLSYSFDDKGQTTTRTDSNGTATYNWDARGRLTSANLPNGNTVSYTYDALGRRSSRTANNQTTNFIYDGQDIVQDKTDTTIEADYINGFGIDDKLKVSNNSGSLYFLKDHLGSTQGLTGVSGNVAEWQQYEAFGKSNLPNSLTRYGFTGRERDEETGLMYYRARWYDTDQGRFISQDPIGFAGGMNFNSYVGNNPLSYTDALGLLDPAGFDYVAAQRAIQSAQQAAPAVTTAVGGLAAAGVLKVGAVAIGGLAIGYAIGYYPGQWIARYNYPEQFPQPQTASQPQQPKQPTIAKGGEVCRTKPQTSPTPDNKRTCTLSSSSIVGRSGDVYTTKYCKYSCTDGNPCWTDANRFGTATGELTCSGVPSPIIVPKGVNYVPRDPNIIR